MNKDDYNNKNDNMEDNNSSKYSFHFNPQYDYYEEDVNGNDKNFEYQNVRKRVYKPDNRKSSGIVSILGIAFMFVLLAIFVIALIIR